MNHRSSRISQRVVDQETSAPLQQVIVWQAAVPSILGFLQSRNRITGEPFAVGESRTPIMFRFVSHGPGIDRSVQEYIDQEIIAFELYIDVEGNPERWGMARDDPEDAYQPSLQKPKLDQLSSTSRIFSMPGSASSTSPLSGHNWSQNSIASMPSHLNEEVDISHVRLSSVRSSTMTSHIQESNRRNQLSKLLPETLRVGTSTSQSSASFNAFSRNTIPSYEPLSPTNYLSKMSSSRRNGSKWGSKMRRGPAFGSRQGSISDEEIDMSLLGSAMPMSFSTPKTTYAADEGDDPEDVGMVTSMANGPFDISSFTGPMDLQSEAQLRELNRQEASGILTGGLGMGLKPNTTLTSSDLFASASQTSHSPAVVSRRISFRTPQLARTKTLRDLGQIEANKRGEIIEVIVVEEPTVDISSVAGGSRTNVDFDDLDGPNRNRKAVFQPSKVEVFYPQENWKPISMRWQYLTMLILISATLAIAQEYLFQKSSRGPLYEYNTPGDLNTWDYFCFKYLPTLVAVSFGVLWQITDFEVKRLEAFYQLSKEGGALAAESINVDYITFFNFLRPLRALKFKHYAVAVSSIATLLAVSLVPTLQSASMKLTPNRAAREKDPLGPKQIHIDAIFSRCLSVILAAVAIFGCALVWQLQRRRSGLVADVKGIAGIAAMANRSHILMDFKNMDTATPEMIHHTLKAHRYTLRNSSMAPEEKVPLTQADKDKYDQQRRPENPHPLMLRLVAGIPFIIGMMLFLVLVPIILFTNANIVTDKAPWLLTGLAVCIKLAWGTLETDVRMMEPFYILSRRHASPKVLALDYTAMAFGWMPINAFLNGHFLVGFVGLGSVLAEVLTVCATSFSAVAGKDFRSPLPPHANARQKGSSAPNTGSGADAGEETFLSFWVSFGLLLFITTFLCLVATLVYFRCRHPFLPRQPNTIASILAFIHQSKMLYDFVGTEKMNNDEMVKKLVAIGKTYGLGWFTGRDGEMHCGVDEEELVSNYKHGNDARKARMPWTTNWSDY